MKNLFAIIVLTICSTYSNVYAAEQAAPKIYAWTSGLDLSLTWTPISGATGYNLYYVPNPYKAEYTVGKIHLDGNTTDFSITLWDGASYQVIVPAEIIEKEGEYSNTVIFTTNDVETDSSRINAWSLSTYGDDVYLGCWSCNQDNKDSIHSTYGTYGSKYSSTSIKNGYSLYGSRYSSDSACSVYARNPPELYDSKYYYGQLSINSYATDSICNKSSKFYSSNDCILLKTYCSS